MVLRITPTQEYSSQPQIKLLLNSELTIMWPVTEEYSSVMFLVCHFFFKKNWLIVCFVYFSKSRCKAISFFQVKLPSYFIYCQVKLPGYFIFPSQVARLFYIFPSQVARLFYIFRSSCKAILYISKSSCQAISFFQVKLPGYFIFPGQVARLFYISK